MLMSVMMHFNIHTDAVSAAYYSGHYTVAIATYRYNLYGNTQLYAAGGCMVRAS